MWARPASPPQHRGSHRRCPNRLTAALSAPEANSPGERAAQREAFLFILLLLLGLLSPGLPAQPLRPQLSPPWGSGPARPARPLLPPPPPVPVAALPLSPSPGGDGGGAANPLAEVAQGLVVEIAALLPLQVAGVEGQQDAGRAHGGAGHPLPARHRHSQQDGRRHLTPSLRLSPRRAPGAHQQRTRALTPLALREAAPPLRRSGRGAPRLRHVRSGGREGAWRGRRRRAGPAAGRGAPCWPEGSTAGPVPSAALGRSCPFPSRSSRPCWDSQSSRRSPGRTLCACWSARCPSFPVSLRLSLADGRVNPCKSNLCKFSQGGQDETTQWQHSCPELCHPWQHCSGKQSQSQKKLVAKWLQQKERVLLPTGTKETERHSSKGVEKTLIKRSCLNPNVPHWVQPLSQAIITSVIT